MAFRRIVVGLSWGERNLELDRINSPFDESEATENSQLHRFFGIGN